MRNLAQRNPRHWGPSASCSLHLIYSLCHLVLSWLRKKTFVGSPHVSQNLRITARCPLPCMMMFRWQNDLVPLLSFAFSPLPVPCQYRLVPCVSQISCHCHCCGDPLPQMTHEGTGLDTGRRAGHRTTFALTKPTYPPPPIIIRGRVPERSFGRKKTPPPKEESVSNGASVLHKKQVLRARHRSPQSRTRCARRGSTCATSGIYSSPST